MNNESTPPLNFKTVPPVNLDQSSIESARLLLTPIKTSDAKDIFIEFTPAVTRYMHPPPAQSIEDTLEFIRGHLPKRAINNELALVIREKLTNEFLGVCGIHGHNTPMTPELGIWIKIAAHGKGYGSEAILALKKWADLNIQYDYLKYPVDRANIASRKIPESLGGKIIGEEKKPTMWGGELDSLLYAIPLRSAS